MLLNKILEDIYWFWLEEVGEKGWYECLDVLDVQICDCYMVSW